MSTSTYQCMVVYRALHRGKTHHEMDALPLESQRMIVRQSSVSLSFQFCLRSFWERLATIQQYYSTVVKKPSSHCLTGCSLPLGQKSTRKLQNVGSKQDGRAIWKVSIAACTAFHSYESILLLSFPWIQSRLHLIE